MLVEGDGRRYGITNQYIYDIDRVLCILEIKKTLNKPDYLDAFDHLGRIRRKFGENLEKMLSSGEFTPDISGARKSFSQITGQIAPESYSGIHELSRQDGMLFYTLIAEGQSPVSIVHGYGGYKTERGLRNAFLDIFEKNGIDGDKEINVLSIPSLVTSNNFCLVKCNGHPFIGLAGDKSWVVVSSTRYNSARLLLELIWSKICRHCHVAFPVDIEVETLSPLLIAKPFDDGERAGWVCKSIEPNEKQLARDENTLWKPSKVGVAEMAAVNIMIFSGGWLKLDREMNEYLMDKHNCTVDQVVHNLMLTKAFAKDGDYLRPLASTTHVLTSEDGSGYIALDCDRFDTWCAHNSIEPAYMNIIFME